jgi:hypothetical protein
MPITELRAADDERRQAKRTSLADKLTVEAKTLADLKIEKAKIEGDRKVAEADLGPVRYLATLLGAGDQDVLRWFILVVALLLDPAAVLLLLAASARGNQETASRWANERRRPLTGGCGMHTPEGGEPHEDRHRHDGACEHMARSVGRGLNGLDHILFSH